MNTVILGLYFLLQFVLGFLFCFFGYRYIRKIIMAYGFFYGAMVSYLIFAPISGLPTLLSVILSVLIGLGAAILLYFIYNAGIFFTGAGFGALLASTIVLFFGASVSSTFGIVFVLVSAFAVGCLTIVYKRFFIVVSTSYVGGCSLAVYGSYLVLNYAALLKTTDLPVNTLINNLNNSIIAFSTAQYSLIVIAALVLFAAGMVIQFTKTAPVKKVNKNV